MAKYVLLIHGDPALWDAMTAAEKEANTAAHEAFTKAAGDRVLGGEELESPQATTTLRASGGGEPLITDGPFLETKESLGGFYLIEAADLDEAIGLASLLPETRMSHCGVEIRPAIFHG